MNQSLVSRITSEVQRQILFPSDLLSLAIEKLPFAPPKAFRLFLNSFAGGFELNGVSFLAIDTDPNKLKKTWDSVVKNSLDALPASIVFAKGGGGYFFFLQDEGDLVFQGFDNGEWGDIQLCFEEFVIDVIENDL